MTLDLRSSELEHQFIQDRINSVEDQFSQLCAQFSIYTKRIGQVRDSGDELAKTILKQSSKEIINHSLRSSLARFSDILSAVQDYRDTEAQRIEHLITLQMSAYGPICKHAKEDLKKSFSARTREIVKKHNLEKMRGKNPKNWQQINKAEHESEKAKNEATEATTNLAQKIDSFEKRKLEDMKKMFQEFVNIELLFHCKAVELYTSAYSAIKGIKIEEDLQVFRNRFKSPCAISDLNLSPLAKENDVTSEQSNRNPDTTPVKIIDQSEDLASSVSSCTEMSCESVDNVSEKDASDCQMFKPFRWNY